MWVCPGLKWIYNFTKTLVPTLNLHTKFAMYNIKILFCRLGIFNLAFYWAYSPLERWMLEIN